MFLNMGSLISGFSEQLIANPIVILSLFGVTMLFLGLYKKMQEWLLTVSLIGLLATWTIILLNWDAAFAAVPLFNMITFDRGSIAMLAAILAITILLFLLSDHKSFENVHHKGEFYALFFFAICGAALLISFKNLLMLFIGIEILSVALYILAGYNKKDLLSNEASLKYFLMGAFTTGILLMGITLVYGISGSFDLQQIASYTLKYNIHLPPLFLIGMLMLLVAMAFKVSAAPFHFWAPDVYQGAPNIVTAFMSTVVKIAAFGAFYRLFFTAFHFSFDVWQTTIVAIVMLTLVLSNLIATRQSNFKRLLAYSGISNAGFMLMSLLTINVVNANGTHTSQATLLLYVCAYALANIIAFAVLILVKNATGSDELEAFNGLAKRNPWIAAILTVAMCSLAGIPATAGFMGKYYMLMGIIEQGYMTLAIVAVLMSAVSFYYYFAVIKAMYMKEGEVPNLPVNPSYLFVMVVCVLLIFVFGFMPDLLRGILIH
jgi:NADH-quinone oxidoreductase subunit N